MRRKRIGWLLLFSLFSFLFLISIGCFSAGILEHNSGQKGFFKRQSLDNNSNYNTHLDKGKIIRDYTKLSKVIDRQIKKSLHGSKVRLNEITKVADKKMNKELDFQWVDKVVWEYWDEKVDTSSSNEALPEIALRLETQLLAKGGKVLKSVWEENQQYRFLTMQVGFEIGNGEKRIPFVTHTLHLRQSIREKESSSSNPKGKIAFIIDDFGAMMPGTTEILAISRPLTISVLPYRSTTAQEAQLAVDKGFEVMLHLPMEPLNPKVSPGPGAIKTGMSKEEVRKLVIKALAQVPEAKGVNNHMGSKASEDPEIVASILAEIQKRNLFFVDSRTSPKSVISSTAAKLGVPHTENYLFIDNVDRLPAVKKEIRNLAKIALTKGSVVAIGHVRTTTAQAIKEMIPELEAEGIQLVSVSELLKK